MIDFAAARRREVLNTPGTMDRPPSNANLPTDILEPTRAASDQSIQSAPRRNEFAMKLALLPETGILAPGPFAENFGQPIASWLTSILAAAGISPRSGLIPTELADANAVRDTINKLKMEYASELQRASGSRAFQELNSLLAAIPSGGINREAAATIVADTFVRDQRNIDFNNFVRDFMRRTDLNPTQQHYAGADLREIYASQDPMYVNERKFIEQLMLNKVNGKPMLNFVLESRGQIPGPVRDAINEMARTAGADPNYVMRYFRMQ